MPLRQPREVPGLAAYRAWKARKVGKPVIQPFPRKTSISYGTEENT